jgi:hypothetical protein
MIMNSPHDTGASVHRFALVDAKKPPPKPDVHRQGSVT